MRLFLWILTLLAASSGVAYADPITAAFTAFTTWMGTLSAGALFVFQMGASLAMSALSRALARKNAPPAPGIRTEQTTAGETTPASLILGTYATAGNHVCPPMTFGKHGKTPNAYMMYVVDLADAPIDGLMAVWIDDRRIDLTTITPDGDGFLNLPEPYNDGRAKLKFRDGSATTAEQFLLDRFDKSDQPRRWTSDMIGRGIPHVCMEFRYDREVFKGLPRVLFEVRGMRLYDPRRDSEVGGSGPQRWGNPATWAHTNNPAVMVYNILRGITLPDGTKWGGDCAAEDLPLASWFAAMNECDRLVDGQPQYRAGYEVRIGPEALGGDEPAGVIEELLRACGGVLCEIGGVWKIRVGGPGLPVAVLTDDDIIVTEPQDYTPFPGIDGTYNGIHAQYPEPEEKWASKEAPPRYNAAYEAADGGRRLVASLQLPACPWRDQVQRIMRAYIEEERRFRRHTLTLPPDYAALEPLDAVAWTSAQNGYQTKIFEVVSVTVDPVTLCARVELRERDPADYAWSSDMALPVSIQTVTRPLPVAQAVPGWAVAGVVIHDDEGNPRRAACQMTWDPDQPDVRGVQYEIRAVGRQDLAAQGSTQAVSAGGLRVIDGILPGAAMQARARLVVDRPTRWTDWTDFAAPAVGLSEKDFSAAVRAKIDAAQADAEAAQQEALAAKAQAEAAITHADQAVANAKAQIKTAYEEFAVSKDNAVKSWVQQTYMTKSGSDQAIASTRQELNAAIADTDALVTQTSTSLASLKGSVATFRWLAKAEGAGAAGIEAVSVNQDGEQTRSAVLLHGDQVIVPGSLSASALTVGLGGNLLVDPGFDDGMAHILEGGSVDASSRKVALRGDGLGFRHPSRPTLMLFQSTAHSDPNLFVRAQMMPVGENDTRQKGVPVTQGNVYIASAYFRTIRAEAQICIYWYDADGNSISYDASGREQSLDGVHNIPDSWPRRYVKATAPDGAAFASVAFLKRDTLPGETSSYLFVWKPMLEEVTENASQPGPWSPGGVTYINGGRLFANSVTAREANFESLSAISANIGTFQSAPAGARVKIQDDAIIVYRADGSVAVKIGNLARS